ncbi:MAG TPA: MFS transporter [Chloroflexia bacterium]
MIAVLRQRNFALLWFGGLISMAGDWVLRIGLPLYIYQVTGSTLATGIMFMAAMLPSLLLGSVAGVFVDRWDRKQTMVIANVLLAGSLLPLLLVRSAEWVWIAYIAAFAQSCIAQFFDPAESAMLPLLVGEEHLPTANALNALNNNLARLIGPAIGGVVLAVGGLTGVALVDAASFLIAAGMIALITANGRAVRAETPAAAEGAGGRWLAVWREWVEGLRIVVQTRTVAIIFLLLGITSLGEGVISVLFAPFVSKVLGGGGTEFGAIASAQAVGGLIGGALIGEVARRVRPGRLIGVCGILFGLIDLAIFNYPVFGAAVILMVLVGLPGVGFSTGVTTLLQTSTANQYLGRVFGALGTTASLLALIGAGLASVLGDRIGIVPVLNLQGAGYILAGALALVLLAHVALPRAQAPAEESVPA